MGNDSPSMGSPCRISNRHHSYQSIGSPQHTPKQYRILGLPNKASSTCTSTFTPSVFSLSRPETPTPQMIPRALSDNLFTLIQNIIVYFDLFDRLPSHLIDRNLRMEKPTDTFSAYHEMETQLSRCILGLRDTLWSIQTQLKDENAFVRKIFQGFEYQIRKYLTRCLKGWKGMLLIRRSVRHYRAVSNVRRILRRELDVVKEIMDAVGPHCKDMLLNVDVEIVADWIIVLDGTVVQTRAVVAQRSIPRNEIIGFEVEKSGRSSPSQSEKSMSRLFRFYRLPAYSFSSNRLPAPMSDREMNKEFSKGRTARRSYLRASILSLN